MICSISPEASLIAIMLSKSFANLNVVLADMFEDVLPGTLYKIIFVGQASDMALKC